MTFPPLTTFAPEHFAVCRGRDTGKHKQFRRGIEQLDSEGVVQVLRSDRRGEQAPVLAVVGPMQFEVATHRMEHEFGAAGRPRPAALQPGAAHRRGLGARRLDRARRRGAAAHQRRAASRCSGDKWGLRVFKEKQARTAAGAPGRRPALS